MKVTLLACSIALLLNLSDYQGFQKRQEPVCHGKAIPVSVLDPKLSEPHISFPNSGIWSRLRLAIRDRAEFNKLWEEMNRFGSYKPPLPEVDFTREMIVVAAMGQQPTGGYAIIIDGACQVNNQLEVFVRSTNYLKCGGTIQAVTAPVDIVRLPKTDLPLVFRETEVVSDCSEFKRRSN